MPAPHYLPVPYHGFALPLAPLQKLFDNLGNELLPAAVKVTFESMANAYMHRRCLVPSVDVPILVPALSATG